MIDEVKSLTISAEVVVDVAKYHGKDKAREVFHEILDQWMDRYLKDEDK